MLSVLLSYCSISKFTLYIFAILLCAWVNAANDPDSICDGQTDGSILPNPNLSNSYYACMDEKAALIVCDDRMVFSVQEHQCVRENLDELEIHITNEHLIMLSTQPQFELIDNDESTVSTTQPVASTTAAAAENYTVVPTTSPTSAVPATTALPILTIATTTAKSNNMLELNVCPCQDSFTPTYVKSNDFCDRYFMCYRGRPLEMSCCRGHHWNSVTQRCVPEYESYCEDINSVIVMPDCPEIGRAFYPHPYVCEYFYYCENGHRSIQRCDAFYYWDYFQQRCVLKTKAICITSLSKSRQRKIYLQ